MRKAIHSLVYAIGYACGILREPSLLFFFVVMALLVVYMPFTAACLALFSLAFLAAIAVQ
jgi:uncharacterized membrane protein YccF (DUF307 family)